MGSEHRLRCRFTWAFVALVAVVPAAAQRASTNLTGLSLEDLSNIEITTVSKRAERLSDAPTSVFVITGADIRRSGATSLPEALRLAPNLHVARVTATGYAISARGFNSSSANKLLVLIDGRSVYTPLFSGVFWDIQDVLLEDVERIEVISGPGGTLWGVNAVNGVINVITRSSSQTHGELIVAGAGNREAQIAARHGDALGAADYRLYAKHIDRRHTATATGAKVNDAAHFTQVGLRGDWGSAADKITLHADVYRGRFNQPLPGTIAISGVNLDLGTIAASGANLIVRWERQLEGGSSLTAQAYYDHTQRTVPPTFSETLDIVDLQLQHSSRLAGIHTFVWGAQYRYAMDDVTNSVHVAFLPASVEQTWASLFAQDEIALRDDLRLTLGARLERNAYTGLEWLPNARLAWKAGADHLLWVAASRTVRAPSRLDRDTFVPGQPPFLLAGGPNVRSETADVYELGYRGQPTPSVSFSVTAFHADYDHLRTQELAASQTFVFFANGMQGTVRGLEMWGSYQAMPRWRLHGGYTRLLQKLKLDPGSNDGAAVAAAQGSNPGRRLMLRSSWDLPRQIELDVTARYVSALSTPTVPSYLAVDVRCAWQFRPGMELSITGHNVIGPSHGEFTSSSTRTEFGRSVFVALASRF